MARPPVTLTHKAGQHSKIPGHMNRHVRLRYATVQEHLDQAMATRALRGNARVPCPICDFYVEHLGEDVRDVERLLLANKEWGAFACCDTIRNTTRYNNPGTHPHGAIIAAAIQHDCALALDEYHGDETIRGPLENLLRDPAVTIVSPEALYILVALINRVHPNPRRFLEQPAVRAKLPADLDLSLFAAPDFDPT